MILHPGIIALLLGSAISSLLLLYASVTGVRILRNWDGLSSSESQLSLERRTYLVSTIMSFVLAFEVLSMFLFVYTVDDLHRQFVGAMCATGSLNANPVGWYLLYLKMVLFFLSTLWVGVNYVDQRTESFPLVRFRYALLLLIFPLVLLEAYLQADYFLGLTPNIITSCCGSLFSGEGGGVPGSLSSLPVRPMEYLFFLSIGGYIMVGLLSIFTGMGGFRYLTGILAVIVFPVSIAAIISFISLYFYEIPTHHCPFDILQGYYNYIGYPLYGSLFIGTALGMLSGLLEVLKERIGDSVDVEHYQRRWTILSIVLLTIFLLISLYPMVFSSFTLEGY